MCMADKLWINREGEESEVERLSAGAGISKLLARVFCSRGVTDAGYVRDFLNPALERLHSPFLLKDMEKAVDRLVKAVEGGEKIVIYGDYDADGITSTAVLFDFLSRMGAAVDYYIPDRFEDGYGLSARSVDRVLETGAALIITVDCGITATDEIGRINENNVQVIVTDHHECKGTLPPAFAVINPHRPDCSYPFKELAGVGVVFKLVHALCLVMNAGELYLSYLDMVALGTVADVVKLLGENRIIVKFGLAAIEKTVNPGLRALINVAGLKDKPVSTYGVGFGLTPRINAAGRTGSAVRAVRLLTASDTRTAEEIAADLDGENKYRQQAETDILQQAVAYIEACVDLEREKVIIASGKGWHQGIIGIVASRIVEKYCRPCILVSEEDGIGRGSGRSIEGFNLFEALAYCESFLLKYGGHELAAGLSLDMVNLPDFREKINGYANGVLTEADLIPRLKIDSHIKKEDMSLDSISELEKLAPFGPGNPGPVFSIEGLRIGEIRTVGDNKHLKLRLEDEGFSIDAVGFNMGELAGCYLVSDLLDSVFSLEINAWNGSRKPQMVLKDMRQHKTIVFSGSNDYNINIGDVEAAGLRAPREIIPDREDLAAVYRYIINVNKSQEQNGGLQLAADELSGLSKNISGKYRVDMNQFKFYKCIEIFEELKLMKREPDGGGGIRITITANVKEKVNLEDSAVYRELQSLKKKRA